MLAGFVVSVVYAALWLAAVSVLGSVTRAQYGGQPGLPPGALENLVAVTEVATLDFSVLAALCLVGRGLAGEATRPAFLRW